MPSDTAGYIVEMLTKNRQIVRPLSGVSILDSKQARQAYGIPKGMLMLEIGGGQARDAGGPSPDLGDFDAPRAVSSRSGTQ
jgi:hypothetical protein